MARNRKLTPSYLEHKQSGRGRLVWTDTSGVRQQKLLPGTFGSPESLAAKARLELELATSPGGMLAEASDVTVAELLAAYLTHAERHYRGPDGKPTSKLCEVKIVMKAVREMYAELPVAEFGPSKLKALRQYWLNMRHVRTEINRRVGMVKRIVKWGVSEELLPRPSTRHSRRSADCNADGPKRRRVNPSVRSMTRRSMPPCLS
jgi:hypothetical protein